jgi:HSP20 family molecular chaperone IbpA
MVRRIKPVSCRQRTEAEIRKPAGATPVRRRSLLDPGEVAFPAVDIYENADAVVIEMELPGVAVSDVTVLLHANRLEIKGLKRELTVASDMRYLRLEREFGGFRRELIIPCAVDAGQASATLENGLLTVTLRKAAKTSRGVDIARGRKGGS